MQQSPTQIVQSFWLRFWSESSQAEPQQWRGTIWHEQQSPGEKPRPVAGPEEAFEIVRRALDLPSALDNPKSPPATADDTRRHHLLEWLYHHALAPSHLLPALMRRFRRRKQRQAGESSSL